MNEPPDEYKQKNENPSKNKTKDKINLTSN